MSNHLLNPKVQIKFAVLQQMVNQNGLGFVSKKIIRKLSEQVRILVSRFLKSPPLDVPFSKDPDYQDWLSQNYPRSTDLQRIKKMSTLLSDQPLISIVMPVFDPPEQFLKEAIESVLEQVYPHWELCIADDASRNPAIQKLLEKYRKQDERIKITLRAENGHISKASNSALNLAKGEFIALLDHDDCLAPHALFEVALLLNEFPELDMIYSDEDQIDAMGNLSHPYFKPDWSPDTLLSQMYTCHLSVYRKALVEKIEGFREGFEGAQDYDLVLRLTETTDKIHHIPLILYHWRRHSASTAEDISNKSYSVEASINALSDALERRAEPGVVSQAPYSHFIVHYEILEPELVSVIIPTRDYPQILEQCLESVFSKTTYPYFEVLVIDNDSQEEKTAKLIDKWTQKEPQRFQSERMEIPFNYSTLNNQAVAQTKGKYLLFLNNDTEVITPDWMSNMVGQAQRPSIGAVGTLLLYPDRTIQHAGIILGTHGLCGLSHQHFSEIASGVQNRIQTIQNYSAVTAACLMCRRSVFEEVNGFEEELALNYNDVDFCLKLIEKGYKNVYLPHARLFHHESKSRGHDITPQQRTRFEQEADFFKQKWSHYLENDPYYNPNLSQKHTDFRLKIK